MKLSKSDAIRIAIEQAEHSDAEITFCDVCGQKLRITAERMGKVLTCPTCGNKFATHKRPQVSKAIHDHIDQILLWLIVLISLGSITVVAFYYSMWVAGIVVLVSLAAAYAVHKIFTFLSGDVE